MVSSPLPKKSLKIEQQPFYIVTLGYYHPKNAEKLKTGLLLAILWYIKDTITNVRGHSITTWTTPNVISFLRFIIDNNLTKLLKQQKFELNQIQE